MSSSEVVLAEVLDHAPDLVVGVREEAGEDLHHPRVQPLLFGGKIVPRADPARPFAQRRIRRHDAVLDLLRERALAPGIPTVVEPAHVRLDPLGRHLMRRVHRARREPREERLPRCRLLLVAQHADRLVGEIFGQVVPLVGRARRLDRVIVGLELGRPLVGVAAEEAVVALEAETERPPLERARRTPLGARCQVPLPDRVRRVAVVAQMPGERRGRARDAAVVTLVANRELGQHAHTDSVMVAPGEDRGARRRTQRRHVEPVVAETVGRERVDVRCRDVGAEAAELREAEVVEDDDEHVGPVGAAARWLRQHLGIGRPRSVVRPVDSHAQAAETVIGTCEYPRTVLVCSRTVRSWSTSQVG